MRVEKKQRRKEEKNKPTYKHEKNLIFHISLSTNFLERAHGRARARTRPLAQENYANNGEKNFREQRMLCARHSTKQTISESSAQFTRSIKFYK